MKYRSEIVNILESITLLPCDKIEKLIVTPNNEKYGDFVFPCYKLCNEINNNPNKIAEKINSKINSVYFEKIENVGPYLNFYINKEKLFIDTINKILVESNQIAESDERNEETIFIMNSVVKKEYNCDIQEVYRGIIENALTRVLKKKGYKVYRYTEVDKEISVEKVLELFTKKKLIRYINSVPVISLNNYNLPPIVIENNLGEISNEFKEVLNVISLIEESGGLKIIYITQRAKEQSYKKVIRAVECFFSDYTQCKVVGLPIIKGYHHKLLDNDIKTRLTDLLIEKYINKKSMDKIDNKFEIYMINAITFYLLSKTKDSNLQLDFEDNYIIELWDKVQSTYINVKDIAHKCSIESTVINDSISREDVELVKILEKYDLVIQESLINLDPNLITKYILKVVKKFNEFCNEICKKSKSKDKLPINKYNLAKATYTVLESALYQIGIENIIN